MSPRPTISWRGPPLALQILALLLGGLVVAQLVTLFLTLLLPPAPKAQYGLDDVAAMLIGHEPQTDGAKTLRRTVQAGPPDINGPGWLVTERSRLDLARLMGAAPGDVTLAFYTPLPFAGTTAQRPYAMSDDGFVTPLVRGHDAIRPVALLLMQDGPPGGGGLASISGLGNGDPARVPPPHDGFPPGGGPPGARGDFGRRTSRGRFELGGRGGQAGPLISIAPAAGTTATGRDYIPGDGGVAVPALLRGGAQTTTTTAAAAPTIGTTARNTSATIPLFRPGGEAGLAAQAFGQQPLQGGPPPVFQPGVMARGGIAPPALLGTAVPPVVRVAPALPTQAPAVPAQVPILRPAPPIAPQPFTIPTAPIYAPLIAARDAAVPAPAPSGPPIRIEPVRRGLFGIAPAPFVEGDFIAALRLKDGRWAIVQPAPEPFPNNWQRRVLLWFAIALAVVAPLSWLFARRLVKPLERFAGAAEQLGRDPAVVIGPLDGPAEIGRAAHAFNLMQTRLRTFVEDRTAMVGAISHDLRTPLTRMRFRIEDAPDELREGLLEEVDDMEAMINEVIAFIRDASAPGTRERCDLNLLVEDVVENARMVGSDVTIESAVTAPVEVDVLGMRRLLDNLLENAVKYGTRARIRLSTDADSAIAEVIDEGPGLPEDEMERVFEPFYRSEAARGSDKAGSGLGLAVCRSIARAHGGDVLLLNSGEGFRAQMRVPLVYGAG